MDKKNKEEKQTLQKISRGDDLIGVANTGRPSQTGESISRLSMSRELRRLVFVVFGMVIIFLISYYIITPYFFKVPRDFNYGVDILSLDNFYNEEEDKFTGEDRSVTTFVYSVEEINRHTALINNIFDVRTVLGEKIFDVERLYGVDRKEWSHKAGVGDKNRGGYLFAPRYLSKDDTFVYWHINYDKPLKMIFDSEIVVEGLKLYVFKSNFGVDQTDNLGHLPGVPEERGVNLDVSLTIWVEPISGWLVYYRDNAIAYYYDQKTGARLNPWNKFSNNYTKKSIQNQVQKAKSIKQRLYVSNFFPVTLFFVASLFLFGWGLVKNKKKFILIFTIVSAFILIGFIVVKSMVREQVTMQIIGISRWVSDGNEAYEENIQGFKDALKEEGYIEGKNVIFLSETADSDPHKQQEIARSFIAENVDLIYSLTTPGTQIIKEHISNRPIIFSIVTYPVETGIIEKLERSGNNLVGTRNWIPVLDQLRVFRNVVPTLKHLAFIHRTGEINSTVQLKEMQKATEPFGIEIVDVSVANLFELANALSEIGHVDGIFSACDTFVQSVAEDVIIAFSHKNKIPSFSCNNTGPIKGDLLGLVTDYYHIGQLAGQKAVLILDGATPSSLNTDTGTYPQLYLNQKTATLLGISIPQTVISQANLIIK